MFRNHITLRRKSRVSEKPAVRTSFHIRSGKVALAFAAALQICVVPSQAGAATQWQTLPTTPYPKKRDDIVFANRQVGYYGTGKGELYKTVDGGRNWLIIWNHPGTFIRSLAFLDADNGFLGNLGTGFPDVTDGNALYRTHDGGLHWDPVHIADGAAGGICSIDVLATRIIFEGDVRKRVIIDAAGRANGPAHLLRSEDGGDNWHFIDLSRQAGMILDVKFLTAEHGFVFAATNSDLAQAHALILETNDGGKSWAEVYRSARTNEIIWKAAFPADLIGYATLQNDDPDNRQQRIVKTVDGGRHWTELKLVDDPAAQEFGIGFESPLHGWVGTKAGGFETVDGGKHWSASTLAPKANRIRTRTSAGEKMIYAIGSEVQVNLGSKPVRTSKHRA